MYNHKEESASLPEPFMTVREAADALHLPIFKLQRAVRSGSIPSYTLFTKRKLVRLSEVIECIERSRFGVPGGLGLEGNGCDMNEQCGGGVK